MNAKHVANLLPACAARMGHTKGGYENPQKIASRIGATVGIQGNLSWLGPHMAAKVSQNPTLSTYSWILINATQDSLQFYYS